MVPEDRGEKERVVGCHEKRKAFFIFSGRQRTFFFYKPICVAANWDATSDGK